MSNNKHIGLTDQEVKKRQTEYGKNELNPDKPSNFFKDILRIVSEPMFIMLIFVSLLYFFLGEKKEGIIMLISVAGIITIDIIQELKTARTLKALKKLSAPLITVIREGKEMVIDSVNIVPGDLMIICEGVKIPADGKIIECSDLCIDESTLTGEVAGIWKSISKDNKNNNSIWRQDYVYAGTLTLQGSAIIEVEKIGLNTEYGKIGDKVAKIIPLPTPLQKQIRSLVRFSAIIAICLFVLVTIITYFDLAFLDIKARITESFLSGITLAMAMIPEEFPVILTVFLSMGAWRLAKKHSLVRRLPSVETLGAISTLCIDKTGTVTMNEMKVSETWSKDNDIKELGLLIQLACENNPYDPMEKALIDYTKETDSFDMSLLNQKPFFEYSFTNDLKMMGHVWQIRNNVILSAKGAFESIVKICNLDDYTKKLLEEKVLLMNEVGLRVIAIASTTKYNKDNLPINIMDCELEFRGLIGLIDPPRETINDDIKVCHEAGVNVIMITGDNGITARSIAKKIGFINNDNIVTGEMIDQMSEDELKSSVKSVNIFARVTPNHKMAIIKALKDNGEIVAMTGDGVNDAPALKYADIGIAMGKSGSEVSRETADLILLDDNFSTIVETIKDGRRIYDNIRKAVGYIFAIHVPIALSSLLAPLLGVGLDSLLLLPLHIVLLELVIDPTCSIVLEAQPAESNIMKRKPRKTSGKLLNKKTFIKSIIQGLVIFAFSFGTYYYNLINTGDTMLARTSGLSIIIMANLFLVIINSSSRDFAFQTIKKLIKNKVMIGIVLLTLLLLLAIIYSPINQLLKLTALTVNEFMLYIFLAFISVSWYEIIKLGLKLRWWSSGISN